MKLIYKLAALAALAFLAAVAFYLNRPLKAPSVACNSGSRDQAAVLIVGDSYVTNGKLIDGFEEGLGVPAKVCSVGFAGRTAREVAAELGKNYSAQLFGRAPDLMVAVVGVNDVLRQSGADGYAEGLTQLSAYPAGQFAAYEIAAVDEGAYSPSTLSAAKRIAYRFWFDGGKTGVLPDYRKAAPVETIPAIELPLLPDHVHLTEESNDQLGRYLGRAASGKLRSAQ